VTVGWSGGDADARLVESEGHLSLAGDACAKGFADLRQALDSTA
jgi:hypothetical protein